MSMLSKAQAGLAANQEKRWHEAIPLLSAAIADAQSPQWLMARSHAYVQTGNYLRALRDAEAAYCVSAARGNDKSRKGMIEAQYRRAVAYLRLKEYANADACAVWSQQLAKGLPAGGPDTVSTNVDENGDYLATAAQAHDDVFNDGEKASPRAEILGQAFRDKPYQKDWNKAYSWRQMCLAPMEKLPKGDPGRKVTALRVPAMPPLLDDDDKATETVATTVFDPELDAAKKAAPAPSAAPKSAPADTAFRSQFYQSDGTTNVSLFMKFASKEDAAKVSVEFLPNLITITGVPRDPSTTYLVPHALIVPAGCTFRAATMKLELSLKKAQPGKWADWGREELARPDAAALASPDASATSPSSNATAATAATATARAEPAGEGKGLVYPTSSRHGPKDWDKMGEEEAKEGQDGDVDTWFKTVYSASTPDQQRAMIKSYTESNGTALSMDWESVSKGPVPTSPPDGVEAKKWGSS